MLAANGQNRFQQNLGPDQRCLWRLLESTTSFVGAANVGQIEFNVIALDDTDRNIAGGSRYLATAAWMPGEPGEYERESI